MESLLLALLLLVNSVQSYNAGVEVFLPTGGMNIAAKVLVDTLSEKIQNAQISNLEYHSSFLGKISAGLSNIKVTHFGKPTSLIEVGGSESVILSLHGASVKLEANWYYVKEVAWYPITDSGGVSASASGISATVSVGISDRNGRPGIDFLSCKSKISGIDLKFTGGASWIYNNILGYFIDYLKPSLEELICIKAKDIIEKNGGSELETLNLRSKLTENLIIDYSLASNPVYHKNFIKTFHRGIFVGDDAEDESPRMTTPAGKMIGFSISNTVFNSAFRVLFSKNLLKHSYTFETLDSFLKFLKFDVPPAKGPFLLKISAKNVPEIRFARTGITANFSVVLEMNSLSHEAAPVVLSSLNCSVSAEFNVTIKKNALVGWIKSIKLTVPEVPRLEESMNSLLESMLPDINKGPGMTLPLPNVYGVHIVDASIALNSNFLSITGDLIYRH